MKMDEAIFAGGCFWCVESDFQKFPKVIDVESVYAKEKGSDKYREAVRITFDPTETTYHALVKYFFTKHDPTDPGGSFYDRGFEYTSAIYYLDEDQKKVAEEVRENVAESGLFTKELTTQIVQLSGFSRAEEFHQNYSKKNSSRYESYRKGSGRQDFIDNIESKTN